MVYYMVEYSITYACWANSVKKEGEDPLFAAFAALAAYHQRRDFPV